MDFNSEEKRKRVQEELQTLKKSRDELSLLVDEKDKKADFKIDVQDDRF